MIQRSESLGDFHYDDSPSNRVALSGKPSGILESGFFASPETLCAFRYDVDDDL